MGSICGWKKSTLSFGVTSTSLSREDVTWLSMKAVELVIIVTTTPHDLIRSINKGLLTCTSVQLGKTPAEAITQFDVDLF